MSEASAVLTSKDAALLTDLEIIALGEPGKGPALKRCLERAGLTFKAVATQLGYDPNTDAGRTTVSHWVSERRWPPPATIRQVLSHCNIDRKILLDQFGLQLGTEVTPAKESRELAVALRNELMFEFDEFERRDVIFQSLAEKVLIFQGFKAFDDTRAAQFFFERMDQHGEEKRLRAADRAVNVTPTASKWSRNEGVYPNGSSPQVSSTTASGGSTTSQDSVELDKTVSDDESTRGT